MAFLQFARRRCDISVIEVGLGGRLDATNVLRSRVVLLTNSGKREAENRARLLAMGFAAELFDAVVSDLPFKSGDRVIEVGLARPPRERKRAG